MLPAAGKGGGEETGRGEEERKGRENRREGTENRKLGEIQRGGKKKRGWETRLEMREKSGDEKRRIKEGEQRGD